MLEVTAQEIRRRHYEVREIVLDLLQVRHVPRVPASHPILLPHSLMYAPIPSPLLHMLPPSPRYRTSLQTKYVLPLYT